MEGERTNRGSTFGGSDQPFATVVQLREAGLKLVSVLRLLQSIDGKALWRAEASNNLDSIGRMAREISEEVSAIQSLPECPAPRSSSPSSS